MIFDAQTLEYLVATIVLGIIAYFLKSAIDDQKRDRQMLNDLRVELPTKYVNKDDLTTHLNRIESTLNKIVERLDQKADKA